MNFWDTSAIVPLCVQEPTSALVTDVLIRDEDMVVWWGTRTECISALTRQVREGNLTPLDERNARYVLHTLTQSWIEMQPSEALRGTAERLVAVHPLRAADALQLGAAIVWCRGIAAGQGFVTFDRRLREAGYREGFTVLPEVV
ncbi:MAG: type II toxin-antitoxin system VapC family toxin [Chloroflexota bacterium]|nr:type II toxin-antitoxin system VapC family toxin [Chloroflexota bacterium]